MQSSIHNSVLCSRNNQNCFYQGCAALLASNMALFFPIPDDFGTAYAFSVSKLDFYNALLNVPPDSVIYRLQHNQTAAAKIHAKQKAHL